MTLDQLRIFIAVAEKQHVTQAASQLNLTQSATSAAIAALETKYQIKLFHRVGRGISLTQAGSDFLKEARAVVERARSAVQVLDDLAGLRRGSLNISASQTVANYWLPSRIQNFHKRYPAIDLHITIANTEKAAQAVLDGEADLGFVEGEIDNPCLSVRKVEGDTLIIVVGHAHPWTAKRKITLKDFKSTTWILRESGSGTRSIFEDSLRQLGAKLSDLDIALELPSNESIRAAVESGDGATAISNLVVAQSLAAKTLHRVLFELPKRSFYSLRHKERHSSQAEQALLRSFGI